MPDNVGLNRQQNRQQVLIPNATRSVDCALRQLPFDDVQDPRAQGVARPTERRARWRLFEQLRFVRLIDGRMPTMIQRALEFLNEPVKARSENDQVTCVDR